jgi:hypothetical protein
MKRGEAGRLELQPNIGRRIRWDDPAVPHAYGTIVDVTMSGNGWPRYVVEWDTGIPTWWATVISPECHGLTIEPDTKENPK